MPTLVAPAGIASLAKVLGKSAPGFPVGRITELNGTPGNGASAACIAAAYATLDEGREVVYFDYGGDILERLEVTDDLTVHVNPADGHPSALIAGIENAVRDAKRLVIVDSIDRVIPFADRRAFPLRKLADQINGSSTAVIIVNRYREWPDPQQWLELAYQSYVRVRLTCRHDEEDPAEIMRVRAEVVKTTVSVKSRPEEFYLENGLYEKRFKPEKKKIGTSRFDREDII